jgi:hypothetical protein
MAAGTGDAPCGFRLRFEKSGDARFLSHADLMRTFERALRRTGRPLAYTQGFNPHARMAIRPALALGFAARAAALEVYLESPADAGILAADLGSSLPPGLRFVEAAPLPAGRPAPLVRVVWRYPASTPPPGIAAIPENPIAAVREPSGTLLVTLAVERGRDPPGAAALAGRLWPGADGPGLARGAELTRVEFEDGV